MALAVLAGKDRPLDQANFAPAAEAFIDGHELQPVAARSGDDDLIGRVVRSAFTHLKKASRKAAKAQRNH